MTKKEVKKSHKKPVEKTEEANQKTEDKMEEVKEQINYQAIIDELNDKVLRAAAEVQNTKRIAGLDVQKARDFSIVSFAKDLLSVMDNLKRASESISDEDAANNQQLKNVKDGVEITRKELANVFERHGIKEVNPVDHKFDHDLHQAMAQLDVAGKESGTIIDVMQVGYTLKERLLRPALVAVAK